MAKKNKHSMRDDYLDVDDFADEYEDDDIGIDDHLRIPCPRCGSDTWDELIYDKKTGRPSRCNECRSARVS